MKINPHTSSISENNAFISIIISATEDNEMRETIKTILNFPIGQRKSIIQRMIDDMKRNSVPNDFTQAIEALADEAVAYKIREVLKI